LPALLTNDSRVRPRKKKSSKKCAEGGLGKTVPKVGIIRSGGLGILAFHLNKRGENNEK